MTNVQKYARVCWYDWEGNIRQSRWYRDVDKVEQALAECRIAWPTLKFWTENTKATALPELTIQDLFGGR